MKTIIFLSNHEVAAVEGRLRHGKIRIYRGCRMRAPENSIINGVVTDSRRFNRFLSEFWHVNHLGKRNVILVTGNAKSVSRHLSVPIMSHEKTMRFLAREFSGVRNTEHSVFSYLMTGRYGRLETMFVNLAESDFLENHIRRFREQKIHLRTVVTADMALIAVLDRIFGLSGITCIVQFLDGIGVRNILYVNGHYFHGNHIRLLNEPGTPEAAFECAACIEHMRQFLITQMPEPEISHVYLTGEFAREDLDAMKKLLSGYSGMNIDWLDNAGQELILCSSEETKKLMRPFFGVTGGFWLMGKHSNLLHQYRNFRERKNGRRYMKYIMAAGTFLIMTLLLTAGFLAWDRHRFMTKAEEYLNSIEMISGSREEQEYDRLCKEIEVMRAQMEAMEADRNQLLGYAVYDEKIRQAIEESASELVTFEICSYNGDTGILKIKIFSESSDGFHPFVSRLSRNKDLFKAVKYEGFYRNKQKKGWESKVWIWLLSGKER